MLKVPHGARELLQADFERKQGQKIPAGKMLQKPSAHLPSLLLPKAL
jgi:hypothetical protein